MSSKLKVYKVESEKPTVAVSLFFTNFILYELYTFNSSVVGGEA